MGIDYLWDKGPGSVWVSRVCLGPGSGSEILQVWSAGSPPVGLLAVLRSGLGLSAGSPLLAVLQDLRSPVSRGPTEGPDRVQTGSRQGPGSQSLRGPQI